MLLSAALLETFHVVPVAPTAMIFVPRKDGINHNEIKNVRLERLDAVAAVLRSRRSKSPRSHKLLSIHLS